MLSFGQHIVRHAGSPADAPNLIASSGATDARRGGGRGTIRKMERY
jgi:hypothetical protein